MKKISIAILLFACVGCFTNNEDFRKGKNQLEQQGYSDIRDTGYNFFCCDDKDLYSSGFVCLDKNGNVVKGCICSGVFKGVTIRFQ